MRQFEDARLQQMRRFVGSSGSERAGSPPAWDSALLLDGDQKLGPLLTGYVAEALEHAGYETVVQSSASGGPDRIDPVDGILEGQIEVFWLNRQFPALWHSIVLSLRLVKEPAGRTRWHRSFESRKTAYSLFPSRADYQVVVRQALDKTLSDMVDAFASKEFYTQLESGAPAE